MPGWIAAGQLHVADAGGVVERRELGRARGGLGKIFGVVGRVGKAVRSDRLDRWRLGQCRKVIPKDF